MNTKHLLILVACSFFASSQANAATRIWTGNSSTNWFQNSNWQGGNAPNSSDEVVINAGAVNYPSLTSNTTVRVFILNGGSFTMNNNSLTVQRDFEINGGTFYAGNNTLNIGDDFIMDGGTFLAGSGDIDINDEFRLVAGTFTGGSGTIDADDYIISGGTFSVYGDEIELNDDFIIDGGSVIVVNNDLYIEDDLFLISGTLNLNNYGAVIESEFHMEGGTMINIASINTDILVIDFDGTMDMICPIRVTDEADFVDGILNGTAGNLLIFDYNATVTGADNNSHFNGPVRKEINGGSGTNTFRFPIGNGTLYAPLEISSYTQRRSQDYFTAQYFLGRNPNAAGPKQSGLDHISQAEWWDLSRAATSGTPTTDVDVKLFYDENNRSGSINTASQLRVAHWTGSSWENLGRDFSNSSNNSNTGYTQSSTRATNFSPFTLASSTSLNPLPVELLNFDARPENTQVNVNWTVASERNNAYFKVEKSIDGQNWTEVSIVEAIGNTETVTNYSTIDPSPLAGTQFYRLMQVDIDGTSTYSHLVPVHFKSAQDEVIARVYPNPTAGVLNLNINNPQMEVADIKVFNIFGVEIMTISSADATVEIDLSNFAKGVYFVEINVMGQSFTQKVLKNQ